MFFECNVHHSWQEIPKTLENHVQWKTVMWSEVDHLEPYCPYGPFPHFKARNHHKCSIESCLRMHRSHVQSFSYTSGPEVQCRFDMENNCEIYIQSLFWDKARSFSMVSNPKSMRVMNDGSASHLSLYLKILIQKLKTPSRSSKSLAKVLLDVLPVRQFGIALSCSSTVQDQGAHTPALARVVVGCGGCYLVVYPHFGGCDLMVTTIGE